MSNEKEQDVKKVTEEQVDYQSLFNSLIKENEQKEEPKEELAEKKAVRKKKSTADKKNNCI